MQENEPLDWEQAYKYFDKVRRRYQELAGTPGVNTSFALEYVFRPLAERFERGFSGKQFSSAPDAGT